MRLVLLLLFVCSFCFAKKVIWDNSVAPNVTKHIVYCCDKGTVFDSNFDTNCPHHYVDMPTSEYELPGDFEMNEDVEYTCNVSAMDSDSFESVFEKIEGVTFFFNQLPPAPATSVRVQ